MIIPSCDNNSFDMGLDKKKKLEKPAKMRKVPIDQLDIKAKLLKVILIFFKKIILCIIFA